MPVFDGPTAHSHTIDWGEEKSEKELWQYSYVRAFKTFRYLSSRGREGGRGEERGDRITNAFKSQDIYTHTYIYATVYLHVLSDR